MEDQARIDIVDYAGLSQRKDRIIPRLRLSGTLVRHHVGRPKAAREHSMAAHLATGGVRFVINPDGILLSWLGRYLRRFSTGDTQWIKMR